MTGQPAWLASIKWQIIEMIFAIHEKMEGREGWRWLKSLLSSLWSWASTMCVERMHFRIVGVMVQLWYELLRPMCQDSWDKSCLVVYSIVSCLQREKVQAVHLYLLPMEWWPGVWEGRRRYVVLWIVLFISLLTSSILICMFLFLVMFYLCLSYIYTGCSYLLCPSRCYLCSI